MRTNLLLFTRYGFLDEIGRRYKDYNDDARGLWMLFNQTFALLPYTALVGGEYSVSFFFFKFLT